MSHVSAPDANSIDAKGRRCDADEHRVRKLDVNARWTLPIVDDAYYAVGGGGRLDDIGPNNVSSLVTLLRPAHGLRWLLVFR